MQFVRRRKQAQGRLQNELFAGVERGLVGGVDQEQYSGGRQDLRRDVGIERTNMGADDAETRDSLEVGFVCEFGGDAEIGVDEKERRVWGGSDPQPI